MKTKTINSNKSQYLTKEQKKAAKAFRDSRRNARGMVWQLAKEA